MQALHDVVKAGYVRYIGMSSCYAYQCAFQVPYRVNTTTQFNRLLLQSTLCRVCLASNPTAIPAKHGLSDYAITHNLTPFISMQNQYSLLYREEEREMFPTLKVR